MTIYETSPLRLKPSRSCILVGIEAHVNELRKVETQHVCRVLPKAVAASENLALASP